MVTGFFNLERVAISYSKNMNYDKLLQPEIPKVHSKMITHFLGVIPSELLPSLQIKHFVRFTFFRF